MQNNESKPPPIPKPVPPTFWEEATIVGSRNAMVPIVLVYAACLACASIYSLLYPALIAVVVNVVIDMGVDMLADRKLVKSKSLKFINEVAIGVAGGWIGFLIFVFTVGIFIFDDEKAFGVAFGAGVGLMVVFVPASFIAAICSGRLRTPK